MISPPASVKAVAMRPPSVATRADAPARTSASAISTAACSLPPASRRGTACNMVISAMIEVLRMSADEPQFLEVGEGRKRRNIAYRLADAPGSGPALLWLAGFLSDMASTKALALAEWAQRRGLPMLRFDYSAHGQSSGDFLQASIGDWLEEASAMLDLLAGKRRVIVVGSSMGGWIALLLARKLAQENALERLAGLVLIAPAWDMTERLMWHQMGDEIKAAIERDGVYYEPSLHGDPYPSPRI